MTTQSAFAVRIASYVSSIDAKSDLEAIDALHFDGVVTAYDAALVVNGAWGEAKLASRTSRSSGDFLDGPLHGAFTRLFGGPFMGGDAPPGPIADIDRRLPQETVVRLGDRFPAASVVLVIVALAPDSESITRALSHAEWVASESVAPSDASASRLSDILENVLRRRAVESKPDETAKK
jgi:hypothetical protein